MRAIWQDVRFGLRRLLHSPLPTFTLIATIGLGIGATTAVFTVLDALLLRPLSFQEPDRLVQIWKALPSGSRSPYPSSAEIAVWLESRDLFAPLEVTARRGQVLEGGDEPRHLATAAMTGGMMRMLGVSATLGRVIVPGDEHAPVVVLSDTLWRSSFGSDPDIVGRMIGLDGHAHEVIGVMPPWFRFPDPRAEAWVPLTLPPAADAIRLPYQAIGRLAPGVTLAQAQSRATIIGRGLIDAGLARADSEVEVRPFDEHRVNPVPRQAIWMLFGACGLVLLIACANVAHLLLAQGMSRQLEVATRAALGASRSRLARQLATEGLLLALAGGAAGLLLARSGLHAFLALAPAELTAFNLNEIEIDQRVLGFALIITLGSSLLFALAPAWRTTCVDMHDALRAGRGSTGSRRRQRVGRSLVVAEIALAFVLLTGAGLLLHTFLQVVRHDTGFDHARIISFTIDLPAWRYSDGTSATHLFDSIIDRVRAVPGVAGAALAAGIPPRGGGFYSSFHLAAEGGVASLDGPARGLAMNTVAPGFFEATAIPLLVGREFSTADRIGSPPVVIVSEVLASRLWPAGNALGSRLRFIDDDEADWLTVIGIAGNVYQSHVDQGRHGMAVYYPIGQSSGAWRHRTVVVRAMGDPQALVPSLKTAVWSVDPRQPILRVETGEAAYSEFFAPQRFYAALLGIFAGLGALLAAIGIYGLMAYTVAQRTQEFGVRLAVGAEPRDLAWLVLRQAARLAVAGTALGLAAALAATRAVEGLLIGVARTDPPTYAAVMASLIVVTLAACFLPLYRAARVDPVVALRHE